jgi:hypothetical protein
VGLFKEDCGSHCANTTNNGQYYTCSGSSCSQSKVSLDLQVANPVAFLPSDNNGVVLDLPSVSSSGAGSVDGTLYLGIGTQPNNTPSGVSMYSADSDGNFKTKFSSYSSSSITGFIDSGSSILFFPEISALPDCNSSGGGSHGSDWEGLYCPSSTKSLSAVNTGSSGSPSGTVSFSIANAYTKFSSSNFVFSNIGGSVMSSDIYFDWGLPFFFGKTVFVGINGTSSSLGTGPYWAY